MIKEITINDIRKMIEDRYAPGNGYSISKWYSNLARADLIGESL